AEPPVAALRVGRADEDRVRVVIDLDGARDYRVERPRGATAIVLAIDGDAPSETPHEAAAAAPSASEEPSAEPARPPRPRGRPRIVIDPGHGGDDPGAQGFATEKDVTLDLARRLATLLRRGLRADVVLTRDDDETLALKERTARANAEDADLF